MVRTLTTYDKFFRTLTKNQFMYHLATPLEENWFYNPNQDGYPFTVEDVVRLRMITYCSERINECFRYISEQVDNFADEIFQNDFNYDKNITHPISSRETDSTLTEPKRYVQHSTVEEVAVKSNELFHVLQREYQQLCDDLKHSEQVVWIVSSATFTNTTLVSGIKKYNEEKHTHRKGEG